MRGGTVGDSPLRIAPRATAAIMIKYGMGTELALHIEDRAQALDPTLFQAEAQGVDEHRACVDRWSTVHWSDGEVIDGMGSASENLLL